MAAAQLHVIVDDEMLARIDKIAKKYGLGNKSDVARQAISRWYYEIEKMELKQNGHRTNGNGARK